MMQPDAEWRLPTNHLGQQVWVFEAIDSTNRAALELAATSGKSGLAVLARQQTAGRGQHGRSWLAQPNTSVLLSIILNPPLELRRPALLTVWAAVCVCELVRHHTQRKVRLKWPNDVLLDGRKVCGILIEQQEAIVAGIGLNVRQTLSDFARAGLPDATSLGIFTQNSLEPDILAHELILRLDARYDALLAGDLEDLERHWQEFLGLVGEEVLVECNPAPVRGRLLELSFAGVVVQPQAGEPLRLLPEMVRHLHPA